MSLHLIKMAVGIDSVDALIAVQRTRRHVVGGREVVFGYTRRMPRRRDELIGGSIYWIFKGAVRCRQEIVDLLKEQDGDGADFCRLYLDSQVIATEPVPRRPMQGWRYLAGDEAPPDCRPSADDGDLPAELVAELRELGVW